MLNERSSGGLDLKMSEEISDMSDSKMFSWDLKRYDSNPVVTNDMIQTLEREQQITPLNFSLRHKIILNRLEGMGKNETLE